MSASKSELSELKEWLTNEVKLERYFDKLTNYGFCSLALIQNLNESDLDSIGITPPYHRKRILKFCGDLQKKLVSHSEAECAETGNDLNKIRPEQSDNNEKENIVETSNEEAENDPPPLPPKISKPFCSVDVSKAKPVVPDRGSSLPPQPLDCNMESITPTTSATAASLSTQPVEVLAADLSAKTSSELETKPGLLSEERDVKKIKKPPPVPPRADLDPDLKSQDLIKEGNGDVGLEVGKSISVDETNVCNGQNGKMEKDLGTSGDSLSNTPSQMPVAPEKNSVRKPVARRRASGSGSVSCKEKPVTTPRPTSPPLSTSQLTSKNMTEEGVDQHVKEVPAIATQDSQEKTEEIESIYGNTDECNQAIAAPERLLEKSPIKKPLPAPRKIRPKPQPQNELEKSKLPQTQDKNISNRHSIAIPEENNAATRQIGNGSKHTRSLNRSNKLVPVLPEHDPKKSVPSLREIQDKLPSVPPHGHLAEQATYEVIVDVQKNGKVFQDSVGTYEGVNMPDQKHAQVEEAIYEQVTGDSLEMIPDKIDKKTPASRLRPQDSKPRRDVHPSKLLSTCAEDIKNLLHNSMISMADTSKKKESPDNVIYDYESDESTEGLLLDELPESLDERKSIGKPSLVRKVDSLQEETAQLRVPRAESTDSSDGRQLSKSGTPKTRKTSGYLFKQGGQQNNRGWRKRWFVFDGKELRYYRSEENTTESLHMIPVSQMKDIEFDKDAKKGRFNLKTANRVFMLSSDSMTETNLWAQTIMEAILQYKRDESVKKPGGFMSDPDKEGWLKKQGHNVMGDWKRRYVAVKEEKICYYDSYEDFVYETPIHCVDAKLASVKQDSHRNRFQIITPNKAFSFQAENEFEAASWISAIQTAIQMGLSDHSVINKVWSNPSNTRCADCGKKDPVWAAVNYCMCVCAKCIGIHRSLGVKYSKPRSLLMDERIWNDQLLELMIKIGNENANKLLEYKIPDDDRINPDCDNEKRMEFIFSKYKDMKYMKISRDYGKPEALGQSLQKAVVTGDIIKTMELLLNRADVKYINPDDEDQRTPIDIAKDTGQELQAELLRQNGADSAEEPASMAPSEEPFGFEPVSVPEVSSSHVEVPEKAGFLLLMRKKYWFALKDRHLKYYRNQGDKDPSGVIDLTTMTSLELHAGEDARTMDIVTTDKTYTLKGESDEELELWHTAIKNKQVFKVHLSFQELGSDGIPHLVAHCLQFVETYGLQAEGIYRVNGNQSKIRALRQAFDQDASRVMLTLDDYSVHDVTGTLKKYLRELPEPVCPNNMYKPFIKASRNTDHNTKLFAIKDALVRLPKVNYDTLKRIIGHLKKVIADQAINRMGIENVSMIFGPTLMSNENTGKMDDSSINQEFKIIGDLIQFYEWFFDVDDKEMEKDKLMEEARKKITQLQDLSSGNMNQEFQLDIYVEQKNDNPCLIKVAAGTTTGELCMNIVRKKGLAPETNWALFEMIGKLNLERALQFREKVLPVVMAWEDFGEIRKDNYLIIKENHIAESIQPFVGTALTLEGQLYVREAKKKDWKLSTVILKNGYMVVDKSKSFFKSIKSDKSDNDQWSLHNLVVFVGVPLDKSKGVDTSAGFTVVVKTDQNGNLIRYLCAKDKTEMYRWVAAILNMKHPEGIWTDPTAPAEMTNRRVKDKQIYLGRQSRFLRKEGSSKHIVEEIRTRQKTLRRSGTPS